MRTVGLKLKEAMLLLDLIETGKARCISEHVDGKVKISIESAGGSHIGIISERYKYLFINALIKYGSGDGLLDGLSQTTRR